MEKSSKKDTVFFTLLMTTLIIIYGFTGLGCACGGCGGCGGCGCGGCGCGEVADSDSDGGESYEDGDGASNEAQQPVEPPSVCIGMPRTTDIQISATKSETSSYNTYTYSYSMRACSGNIAYDIYLKGVSRLTCESGSLQDDRTKSGSNTVTSANDYGAVCMYTSTDGEQCAPIT